LVEAEIRGSRSVAKNEIVSCGPDEKDLTVRIVGDTEQWCEGFDWRTGQGFDLQRGLREQEGAE
jgi:hypothetical protein